MISKFFLHTKYSKITVLCFVMLIIFTLPCCSSIHSQKRPISPSSPLATLQTLNALKARCPEISAPEVSTFLQSVVNRVSRDKIFPKIHLLRCETPITLITPNGSMLISLGMLKSIPNEASLAFLLAHEISHISLNHYNQSGKNSSHTIEDELYADREALKRIIGGYYNPYAAIRIFTDPSLINHESSIGKTKTHPEIQKRAKLLQEHLATSEWNPPGTVSSRRFKWLKKVLS